MRITAKLYGGPSDGEEMKFDFLQKEILIPSPENLTNIDPFAQPDFGSELRLPVETYLRIGNTADYQWKRKKD